MIPTKTKNRPRRSRHSADPIRHRAGTCDIRAVAKRRDGGTRYWCIRHKADATAKYGVKARRCRAAHLPRFTGKPLDLNVDAFLGGIVLWGAVPPVYDTTRLPVDRGIHVHARRSKTDTKEIDVTYREVRLTGRELPKDGLRITELDAIYYMVSSMFGFKTRRVQCPSCAEFHLDKDWFSVHPHGRHLCAGCGRIFRDSAVGIGNPIQEMRRLFGAQERKSKSANRSISLKQSDYPGGIQVWGSNQAILWTGEKDEEAGIHLHTFESAKLTPDIDETFSQVTIDGVKLDTLTVQYLMAQNTMPHLSGRVQTLHCRECSHPAFDRGEMAFTPSAVRACARCGAEVRSATRTRKVISNPLVGILDILRECAARTPQSPILSDLLPEAP
jgi:hypothetical protein